jgi:hypothetical protein
MKRLRIAQWGIKNSERSIFKFDMSHDGS